MKKKKIKPINDFPPFTTNWAALHILSKKLNEVISLLNDESKTAGTTVPKKEKKDK